MSIFKKVDFIKQAKEQLVSQYKNSSNLIAYINVFMKQFNEIEQVLDDLINKRHLDVASGAQLDVIGRIVGISRFLINADDLGFFRFTDANAPINNPNQGFGDFGNSEIGGVFRDAGQAPSGNVRLTDEQFRKFIRFQIAKNTTDCTIESLTTIYSDLFEAKVSISTGQGEMRLIIYRELTPFEIAILKLKDTENRPFAPRPAAILLRVIAAPLPVFTFSGNPLGAGFNEGKFASIII
jgi:hypothetical protein